MCPGHKSKPYYEALPEALKPLHYDVSVFDIGENVYEGVVKISFAVQESTNSVYLHYRDLQIKSVTASYENNDYAGSVVEQNSKKEFFVTEFGPQFEAGSKLAVEISFSGIIQTNMAGFYKSTYKENGETKTMLSTQFEATDARRAFPCLDEPALKATFEVHITVAQELTVLGNMPIQDEKKVGAGLKTVTFERTPVMSTYLLAWAIGEFEYIESFTAESYTDGKPLPVRVYTTKGYTEDAQLASEIAPKIVDLFSTVFGVKYPLPKLDLLAVHAFSHNAMENWGLITYRSTALLYSAANSDPSYKQKVAYVVAHEIAHQWFGNLVTMQWWDELWLNEGFATWVGFYAVDRLFPEWDIFAEFVSTSLQEALRLDGLRNSHPIKVAVMDALDIDQLFDVISYLKGASTILMLSTYLSTDLFLKGVGKYLDENKFGNATSEDLWHAVSEVSGKDVGKMMSAWISRIGFPMVNVSEKNGSLELGQSRFLNGGDVKQEEDETVWWIPVSVVEEKPSLQIDSFNDKAVSLQANVSGLFKFNKNTAAPLRINYDPQFLKSHVLPHFAKLTTKDKIGVIADVAAIAVSGDPNTSTVTFLDLTKHITLENDFLGSTYATWHELATRISAFALVFGANDLASRVAAFCRDVYSKLAIKFASESVNRDDYSGLKVRALVMNTAATLHISALNSLAQQAFQKWKSEGVIDSSMRTFVLKSVVSTETVSEEDFAFIMRQVTHPDSLDAREVALGALGSTADLSVARKMLAYMVDESVIPTMDAHFLAVPLSKNPKTRDLLWQFFKDNYQEIYALMSTNMVVLDRFVKMTLCNFQSFAMEMEVRDFFKDKDVHGFERALSQVLDQIHINATWFERDHGSVDAWLKNNEY
ncbi:hypothetical protein OY671_002974 [Metschnikowia pulcherrima]|nr:hypothetical protein OY671_002974 [Metschnikowia pulcherrima]